MYHRNIKEEWSEKWWEEKRNVSYLQVKEEGGSVIRKGILCDNCNELIESGKEIYYRKNYLSDEAFCSKECLIKDVAKARDKLDKLFEKEKSLESSDGKELLEWAQDCLRDAFDFDGEEEY